MSDWLAVLLPIVRALGHLLYLAPGPQNNTPPQAWTHRSKAIRLLGPSLAYKKDARASEASVMPEGMTLTVVWKIVAALAHLLLPLWGASFLTS